MRNLEERQDHFFKKAKELGYPARSVFKLQEIDRRYQLFRPGNIVLDLGCAPGSWLRYISGKIGKNGKVIGVDLQEVAMALDDNTIFIQKDINDLTEDDLGNKKFDVIVSDMAPKLTGIKLVDVTKSLELNKIAFEVVKKHLKPKGHFLFKIFESIDAHDFIAIFRDYFETVKRFSPQATRKASSEFYVICKNLKIT
jgi:23S rRNA (uridine2552-2'-O)-methyltransferase